MLRIGDPRHLHPQRVGFALPWVLILVFLIAGAVPLIAPRRSAGMDGSEFSAERAIEHVANIAQQPRPIGSLAGAAARSYIVRELTAVGLEPQLQTTMVSDYYDDTGTVAVVNVMARIPGSDPTRAVALMGHYDTVPTSPGASDDAAAVAAILETTRALLAGPSLRNDVVLLFTDGEEPAFRYGSSAFLAEHPWADQVGLVINFEAAGGSGPSMLIETNGPQEWIIDEYARAAPHPEAFSFLPETVALIGGSDTDFAPFRDRDIPGLNFAYLRGSPIYHTANDSLDRVALSSLQHHGSHALSLTRRFGNADLAELPDSGESVFFTMIGSLLVRYPAGWTVPLALLAVVLFTVAAIGRIRRGTGTVRSLLFGAGITLTGIGAAMVATTVVWRLFTAVRRTPGVVESYLYLLG